MIYIKVLNDHLVFHTHQKNGKNWYFWPVQKLHLPLQALVSVDKPWPLQSERIWNARHPEMGLVVFVGREKKRGLFWGVGLMLGDFFLMIWFVDVIWMLRWENCWTVCWRWCDYRRKIQSREDVPICWFEKGLQQRSCTRWPRWPCLMCKYLV